MEFKMCRVCLDRDGTICLFDVQDEVQYCVKMMKCANVEIVEGDGMPDSICEACAGELSACYVFAARCEASDRVLRSAAGGVRRHAEEFRRQRVDLFEPIKEEIKPENSLLDSDLFDSYPDQCFLMDQTNSDNDNSQDIQNDAEQNIDEKSKFYSHTKIKKHKKKHYAKILPDHIRKRKVRLKTGPIQCLICDRVMSCHSAYELHMRSHTKERPYSCDICKKSYSTKHILKTHILKHYGITEKKKNTSKSNVANRTPIQCSTCGQMTASRSAMEDHMRIHTGEKPFTCELCGKKYRLKGTLQRHMQTTHPESLPSAQQFICEHCGKIFHARSNIIIHLRVHTGAKPFPCTFCPEKFRQLSSLIRHKRLHTGEKPFSCNTCGKLFRDHSTLNNHYSVHSQERTFSCHLCTKFFKRKESLKAHITRHSKEKPWVCSYCGLRLTSKGNLKVHTNRMHSERSGTCSVCNKPVSDLSAHAQLHAGERPHRCKLCERHFATARSLSHHMGFKHRNKDKYKCAVDDCTRSFPISSMLEFHVLKTHSHLTPYSCGHCSRGFLRASDLSRHCKLNHGAVHTTTRDH